MNDQKDTTETSLNPPPKDTDVVPLTSEGGERRDFWINQKGYELWWLTPDALQNPSVRQFVGISIDAERLWGSLYTEKDNYAEGQRFEFHEYEEMLQKGYVDAPSEEFGPSIGLRLGQAENLATAVEGILEESGLKYISRMKDLVFWKLEHALSPLGLEVVTEAATSTSSGDENYRRGIWAPDDATDEDVRKFIPDSGITYGHFTESREFIPPHLRNTPEDLERFNKIADDLGIPQDQRNHERVRGFVNVIVEARDLLVELQKQITKPSIVGLFPSDHERIYSSSKVIGVMLTILEAGFKGKQIDKDLIARELNDGLTKNYGVTVKRKPQSENLLAT